MDEGIGALVGFVVVAAIVISIVGAIVKALIYVFVGIFLGATNVLGHPYFVVALLMALGALGGLLYHRKKAGIQIAKTDADFAEVGALRLLPTGWAILMILSFIGILALYGLLFL